MLLCLGLIFFILICFFVLRYNMFIYLEFNFFVVVNFFGGDISLFFFVMNLIILDLYNGLNFFLNFLIL